MMAASPPPQHPPIAPVSNDDLPEPHAAVTEAANETEMPLPSDAQTFRRDGHGASSRCIPSRHSSRD